MLFNLGRDEILSRNAQITRDAVEREGMDANILLAGGTAAADEVIGQVTDLAAASYIDSAPGLDQNSNALDRLLFDRYGLIRKPAAASVGSVQLSTPTPNPATFSIPAGAIFQSNTGVQYIATSAQIFLGLVSGPVTVDVRSVLAGPNLNAAPNTITGIGTPIVGSPSNLVVTNQFATTGSDDVESDDSFRARGQLFFTTARRGTNTALVVAALGVPGVKTASVYEVIDALGRPVRFVQLVVADSFTEQFIDTTVVPPVFPQLSQALSSSVFDALADVRPAGTYVQVIVANVIVQPVQLALSFIAGADVNTTALLARAAVVSYMNGLAPGAKFVYKTAEGLLQLIPGLNWTGQEIISPLGDVVPKSLQVLRTTLGLVSAGSAQSDQPIATGSNPDAFNVAIN